jgi:hypothetical protein
MTLLLGAAPWIFWFAWFIGWEVNGFRKTHDGWPTVSELVKRWERHSWPEEAVSWDQAHGFATWTWRRWLVALGLPGLGIVLELHWVFEVF